MDKKKQDIAYFVSFCIEQYKNAKGLTGAEAAKELDYYGVLEYFEEHYDMLHTQSHQWILEDIDEFINIRERRGVNNGRNNPKQSLSALAIRGGMDGRMAFRRQECQHRGGDKDDILF